MADSEKRELHGSGVGATAAAYFGQMADSYDELIAAAVPRYSEMSDRLVEYLPGKPARILELGCGTGNLTLRLAARFPEAALTYVDAAPEMVNLSRTRLEQQYPAVAARSSGAVLRFEEIDFSDEFGLVTSCISLHHVQDKASLYRGVFRALCTGGTFRFADQLAGATQFNHSINWERWLDYCREPGHCDAESIQSLVDHAHAHDHYVALADHFAMLRDAGFGAVDCVWRNWMWGIVTADR